MRSRRLAILLALAAGACGGGGGGAPANAGGLTIALTPPDTTIDAGGTVTFRVVVSGSNDTRVRFELTGGPGAISTAGVYAAPTAVAVSGVVANVRAVALADESKVATATVRLRASGGGGGSMGTLEALGVRLGVTGASELTDLLQRGNSNGVEAAVTAARLTGAVQPVRSGTLRQQTGGGVAYEPTPTDRLVVIPLAAETTTFRFTTMNGDFSSAPASFFNNDHDLDIRIESAGQGDLQATSQRRYRTILRSLRGTRIIDGNMVNVDQTEEERIIFESSGGGVEFRSTYAVRGSIEGQGIHVQVQDDLAHHYLYTTRGVSNRARMLASNWQVNDVRFELRDGALDVAFADGRAVDLNTYWRATGTVLRNGVQVGTIQPSIENNFYIVRLVGGTQPIELTRIFLGV